MDTVGVGSSVDVQSYLNWTKLSWDIDSLGTGVSDVEFAETDITSAFVTNATTLTVTLEDTKATSLTGNVGFGAPNIANTGILADNFDVTAGFIRDAALNASTTDALADGTIAYSDTTAPTVSAFTSSTGDGSYKDGDLINITATMSEVVVGGTALSVTLGTGDVIALSTTNSGSSLTGTYTVSAGDTSSDLTINSFTITGGQDLFGNTLTSTTLPAGANLADSKNIVIDNIPIIAVGDGDVTDSNSNSLIESGEVIVFKFSEVVANKSTIETYLGSAQFGSSSSATAAWDDPSKKLEVILGTGTFINNGDTVQFSVVEDLAGNQSTLNYTIVVM